MLIRDTSYGSNAISLLGVTSEIGCLGVRGSFFGVQDSTFFKFLYFSSFWGQFGSAFLIGIRMPTRHPRRVNVTTLDTSSLYAPNGGN